MKSTVTQKSTKINCIKSQCGRKNFLMSNMISGEEHQNPNECCWLAFICIKKRQLRQFDVYQENVIFTRTIERN